MKSSLIVHPEELSKRWVDRLADAVVDTIGIHPRGGADAVGSLGELCARMQTPEYRALVDYARGRGLHVAYEMHAAGYLVPRDLFPEHPEYFRMNPAGERTADYNFCVTNEAALTLYATRAAELAQALYGSDHDFYFWMDDGYALHCHCPRCRHMSASDQQMLVLNRTLVEIRRHLPDARMAYLAYMDTMVPPTIAPEEGIFLEYAPFQKYTATGEDAPRRIAQEQEMLVPLMQTFGGEGAKVLEYWYDNSLFSAWKKPPKHFSLRRDEMEWDIAEYRRMGFSEVASFACYLGEDYVELHGDDVDVVPFSDAARRCEGCDA